MAQARKYYLKNNYLTLRSSDKVEEIVDIMTEKEIRLQIPLEEVDILMEETQDKKNEEETQDKKNEEEPK
jgi:predicted transcriptional regulator